MQNVYYKGSSLNTERDKSHICDLFTLDVSSKHCPTQPMVPVSGWLPLCSFDVIPSEYRRR